MDLAGTHGSVYASISPELQLQALLITSSKQVTLFSSRHFLQSFSLIKAWWHIHHKSCISFQSQLCLASIKTLRISASFSLPKTNKCHRGYLTLGRKVTPAFYSLSLHMPILIWNVTASPIHASSITGLCWELSTVQEDVWDRIKACDSGRRTVSVGQWEESAGGFRGWARTGLSEWPF